MRHPACLSRPLSFLPRAFGRRGWIPPGLLALAMLLTGLASARWSYAQTAADSTLVISWTAPGDDGTTGRATSYDLRYRSTPISGIDTLSWWNAATPVPAEPIPGVAGSTDSVRVRGLTPITTYYFVLRVADEVPNWSAYSNVGSAATSGDLTAPGPVADLAMTGTTGTSVSIRWTSPGNDGTTGTAASYDVRYSTSAITSGNWASATQATGEPTPAVAGTVQNFTISGLQGSQIYYVAMKTSDASGNISGLSNVVSGTTLDVIAPAAVRNLTVTR